MDAPHTFFGVPKPYQAMLHELKLTELEQVFTHPRIVAWRSIPERENCVLDATLSDGRAVRLHVKRFARVRAAKPPGEEEADGINLLARAGIPSASLVAWGKLADGRSFVITEDLAGYRAADKAIEAGLPFARLLEPTADMAAKLHDGGLHHRDLYLCHFFVRDDGAQIDLKLIDAARVRPLPGWPFRQRWIVKDLAQFWYSAMHAGVGESDRLGWLARYARQRKLGSVERLRAAVERKAGWIARHDRKLRQQQPNRNVSIPNA